MCKSYKDHVVTSTGGHPRQVSGSPRHLKFIEEKKDNWEKVRVFDSELVDFFLQGEEGISES
jgi:hypothetical protein